MKREFLEKLGLDPETVEKIMAEHGKTISGEVSKTEEKEKEIEVLNEQLKEANKTIKSYKDMNIDDIKKSASDWEDKYNKSLKELEETRKLSAIEKALLKTNTVDVEILKNLIKMDDLKFKGDEIIGLDSQITSIKEAKPFLFKVEETSEPTPFVIKNSEGKPITQSKTNFSDYAEETRLIKN